jgi:hypothetical protein
MIFIVFPFLGLVYFAGLLLAGLLALSDFLLLLVVCLVFGLLCAWYVFSPYRDS